MGPHLDPQSNRILLWRGVDSGVAASWDPEALAQGRFVSKAPATWDEAQSNMNAENFTYGRWWGDRDAAQSYAGDPAKEEGAHMVGAWFSPEDLVEQKSSYGYLARPGATGVIEEAHTSENGRWRPHPDAKGKIVTASGIIRSADAEQAKQTGGMVALYPSTESAQKIVVPGGEPIDDLHLTVTYFGQDVTGQDPTELVDFLYYLTPQFPPVEANIFGTAVFNSTGDDPCIVYLVGNSPHLTPLFQQLKRFALEHYPGAAEQHDPWIPHITAAYGAGAMIDYEGPVVFDRIGIRWPGADQDFNL
ncbi:RNA ligase [Mycobacterium phage I3]|uniref:Phosphodiesterase n=1 Tax=Mycobacterium phage I3 TaxID=2994057 RepID=A0A8F2IWP7_9CAUD|nr:RNA ligase [Mycobacterium phage I3]QWT30375.1 phosphodiesterase [Mycobacterium phage I3]